MKKLILLSAYLITSIGFSQQKPKLVIGIVVDQMKMEYLYRFSDDFSTNGFKRLLNDGYTYHNMHFNYMPTYTGPGHASIFTGTTPLNHGIVSNHWFSRSTQKEVYCTDDETVSLVGDGKEKEGKMSPRNMLTTTISDELKLTTNFKSKVIAMSLKDRGAILPGGHFANTALWMSKTGAFISSTFYSEKLPDWVVQFNEEKRYMNYINKGWNLLKPIASYEESIEDNNKYEGKIDSTKDPVLPYDLKKIYDKKGADIIKSTPFGNDILLDLAKEAISKESLGKDNVTDFLAISLSSPDYIGHTFGVHAIELQDNYLRLDQSIADFLFYLDKNVGKGNYLLFLTSDHAGAENPSYLRDHKYDVKNIEEDIIKKSLETFCETTFGANLILDYSNANLYLDKKMLEQKGLEKEKVNHLLSDYLMTYKEVKRVYTEKEILHPPASDYDLNLIFNGYDPKQNGDLIVLYRTGNIVYSETGTTHGSTNSYDTHAPCIFYGWQIKKGECHEKKEITQIAPTLSQKIKIPFPNGTKCEVLKEILE